VPDRNSPPGQDPGATAENSGSSPTALGRGPGPANDPAADSWLVDKVRGGSVEAYEVLVHRHRSQVYRTALRILGNPADAEDVSQEVFIQAWVALASFTGRASFSTWLYRIVINRSLNHQRRRRRHEPIEDHEPVTHAGPEARVIAQESAKAVAKAIAELPADLRVVFVLHQTEGLTYREVADILNVAEPTVRGRLARARRVLLDRLKEWS
jgi:RNA polymerase sigma-70 factor (ECF subfamily)